LYGLKQKEIKIYSPVKGKVIVLGEIPDRMFSKKMLGEGIAIEIADDVICSPHNGIIRALLPARHAFAIQTQEGIDILVHVGLGTMALKGEGFAAVAGVDDQVTAGQPILKVNRTFVARKGFNLITPVIITNTDMVKEVTIVKTGYVDKNQEIIKCQL
jgi:PTS system glucose-specific IIA component